ncbi:M48 family metallopeptidase [Belnapia sp. T18]|uniref:M48 family metallopeptidase n=1 Tax=Belnapia arida TaxID=2804533 RepID=A0ABS1U0W6_9PROT|nr:SprT family zinc-dependent metalloprotease [Belnapia arida]MBL6078317.1 M48 family metallopeptidase [Belnapia arida]
MDQDDESFGQEAALPGPVQWRRSARARRVSLRIDVRSGSVVVTLPPRAGRPAGVALLTTHAAWVRERLAALAPPVIFAPGAEVPLGGAAHVVRVTGERSGEAWLEPGAILLGGDADVAGRVAALLQEEARERIAGLVARHAAALGLGVRRIRLKDTRSRWGSCAPDGTLAFSWRLVMAPGWVLDYVVAHEVAHLGAMNHSPEFWTLVERLTPHRHAAVAWLKENGPGLLRAG